MAKKSILTTYTGERDKQLTNNSEKYNLIVGDLSTSAKTVYGVSEEANNESLYEKYEGLLNYTYGIDSEYSKTLNEGYGRNLDEFSAYAVPTVKPSFKVNDYEGSSNYLTYVENVYGRKESYFGFLSKLSGVKEAAENLFLDIVNDSEGRNFTDYINDIRKIDDFRYAMEADKVGIVRNAKPMLIILVVKILD